MCEEKQKRDKEESTVKSCVGWIGKGEEKGCI